VHPRGLISRIPATADSDGLASRARPSGARARAALRYARFREQEVQARSAGLALVVIGTLLSVVLLAGFRHNHLWAWWVMWVLPAWAAGVVGLILTIGIAPGQPPPTPAFSGAVVAVLSTTLLLVSAPRFSEPKARTELAQKP